MPGPGRRFPGLAFDNAGSFYFADWENGEILMIPWEDLWQIVASGQVIDSETLLDYYAWVIKDGLNQPADIELENTSPIAQRTLIISYREGLERIILPVLGRIQTGSGDDTIIDIKAKRYLDEYSAVIDPEGWFRIEPTYEDALYRSMRLNVQYVTPEGQKYWDEKFISFSSYGVTILENFK